MKEEKKNQLVDAEVGLAPIEDKTR